MEDTHKTLACRWFTTWWSTGNLSLIDEIFAPSILLNGEPQTTAALKGMIASQTFPFSSVTVSIDAQISEGDSVLTRYTVRGVHTGPFWGIAPTDRPVTMTGLALWRFADGKVVEDWTEMSQLAVLQQLGVYPTP